MATPNQKFTIVRGRVLRVTALDECGSVYDQAEAPECEVVVTDGIISVALSAEVETGEDIRDRNWAGDICVSDRAADQFIRWNVTVTACGVDPALAALLTGAPLEVDAAGDVVGIRTREGGSTGSAALEMWTGTTPRLCGPGVAATYGYTLLPFTKGGRIGDMTLENGRADFIIDGLHTASGEGWGSGPYDVVLDDSEPAVATPLEVPIQSGEHHLLRRTQVAPPAASGDCMTLEEADGTRPV